MWRLATLKMPAVTECWILTKNSTHSQTLTTGPAAPRHPTLPAAEALRQAHVHQSTMRNPFGMAIPSVLTPKCGSLSCIWPTLVPELISHLAIRPLSHDFMHTNGVFEHPSIYSGIVILLPGIERAFAKRPRRDVLASPHDSVRLGRRMFYSCFCFS
jgi:hypothetical protein